MFDSRVKRIIQMLRGGMDLTVARRRLISSNVANAETPGYKAVDIDFEKHLKEGVQNATGSREPGLLRTDFRHFGSSPIEPRFEIIRRPSGDGELRLDGNTVDLELEMAKMAENQFRFQALTNALNRVFKLLEDAVEGGGR